MTTPRRCRMHIITPYRVAIPKKAASSGEMPMAFWMPPPVAARFRVRPEPAGGFATWRCFERCALRLGEVMASEDPAASLLSPSGSALDDQRGHRQATTTQSSICFVFVENNLPLPAAFAAAIIDSIDRSTTWRI